MSTIQPTGGRVLPGPVDADSVEAAVTRLASVAVRTPLQRNTRLSARTGAEVWLKREDLQVGRSYKLRGAYNLIAQLAEPDRAAGVVCASAGNHGQGVAYSCRTLGVRGEIFVPRTTPRQKRDRISALGGDQAGRPAPGCPDRRRRAGRRGLHGGGDRGRRAGHAAGAGHVRGRRGGP